MYVASGRVSVVIMADISDPDTSIYEVRWLHVASGKVYVIRYIGLTEGSLIPVVIYQSAAPQLPGELPPPVWVRPVERFFDGRFERQA